MFKILVLVLVVVYHSYGQECDKTSLRTLDNNMAKLISFGPMGRKFPESKGAQLKKFCNESLVYVREIDRYRTKCLKRLPKQVTGVLVHSMRRVLKKYCGKDSKAVTDLIAALPCANRAKNVLDQCYTTLLDNYQAAFNAEEKMRMPYICCEYSNFFDCMNKVKGENIQGCDEGKVNMLQSVTREAFPNSIGLLCGEYTEGSELCAALGSPPRNEIDTKPKSFLIPLIEALEAGKQV